MGESKAPGRFEALRGKHTGALLDRNLELGFLLGHWQEAKKGAGRVVLLTGEPGIGKSRLANALIERVAGELHQRLRYFCSPHHTDSALHPVIAQVERSAGFEREDTPETRLDKLEALLAPTNPPQEDVALLAALLSLSAASHRYAPLYLSPQRLKEKTFE